MCLEVPGRRRGRGHLTLHGRHNGGDYRRRQLGLYRENVGELPVKTTGPDLLSGCTVDEPGVQPESPSVTA